MYNASPRDTLREPLVYTVDRAGGHHTHNTTNK